MRTAAKPPSSTCSFGQKLYFGSVSVNADLVKFGVFFRFYRDIQFVVNQLLVDCIGHGL